MDCFPYLGHGVGLRPPHYGRIMEGSARADWFEVISENFMIRGGRPLLVLERARGQAPIVLHGVSLNLGGADPLRASYLDELAGLIARSSRRGFPTIYVGVRLAAIMRTTCSPCLIRKKRSN